MFLFRFYLTSQAITNELETSPRFIMGLLKQKDMLILGIAGGTGSGKTTVAQKLAESLPKGTVALIPEDAYYKRAPKGMTLEELKKMNYDHPDAFDWDLLVEHIDMLRKGVAIEQPTYSVLTCDRGEETVHVEPAMVIIVEGIMALHDKRLRDLMDLKVYVDTPSDERLIRLLNRDVVERGRTPQIIIDRYQQTLKPMHDAFIEPTKAYADVIIPLGGENTAAIEMVKAYLLREIN